jgi:hypothetical protein
LSSPTSFPPLSLPIRRFLVLISFLVQILIGEILKVIETNRQKLLSDKSEVSGGSVLVIRTKEENLSIRTQVLLIRSCLATLGALTSDLSAFFHPYISHVLQTVLPLMAMTTTTTSSSSSSFPDSIQLYHDTKAYLSTLIKSIPKRLCSCSGDTNSLLNAGGGS